MILITILQDNKDMEKRMNKMIDAEVLKARIEAAKQSQFPIVRNMAITLERLMLNRNKKEA